MTYLSLTIVLAVANCVSGISKDGGKSELPTIFTVREMLCGFKEEYIGLASLDSSVFPIYEQILNDPDVTRREISGILGILIGIKADRSRFLKYALTNLDNKDKSVRGSAVGLLAEIGTELDSAPIVALLSDEEFTVGVAAAKTLSKIGGAKELLALNIWLTVSKAENYSKEWQGKYQSLRDNVNKSRDALKSRLDKEKAQKPKP